MKRRLNGTIYHLLNFIYHKLDNIYRTLQSNSIDQLRDDRSYTDGQKNLQLFAWTAIQVLAHLRLIKHILFLFIQILDNSTWNVGGLCAKQVGNTTTDDGVNFFQEIILGLSYFSSESFGRLALFAHLP